MRLAKLARQFEERPTEALQSELVTSKGKKRKAILRVLRGRENGKVMNDNAQKTTPDIDLETAKPGDTVKTFEDGSRIVKGDKGDWLYLKKAFVVKWQWEKAEDFRRVFADSYEDAVAIALGKSESSEDSKPEEELFDENDPFAPDMDLKLAKRGDVVKKITGGFQIIRGDTKNWNYLCNFVVKCPGGRMDRPADSYGEALQVVRELQEYGEYIKW